MHDGRLKPLVELVDTAIDDTKMRKEIFGKDASFLTYNIFNALMDYCFPILYKNDINLDILEDKIFEGGEFSKLVEELSIERRNVLNYRRIISPQRAVIANLERAMKKMGFKMADVYFDDLVDHVEKIWGSLEEQKEVVEGLHESNIALVNTVTTDVVRLLTVITVIFLPLTLIASLYGMNVPLPFMDHKFAFELVLGIMLVLLVLMVIFFKKKNWIVLSCIFRLKKGNKKSIQALARDHIKYRKERHPLEYPNAGSVFKNCDLKKFSKKLQEKLSHVVKVDPFPVVPTAYLISEAGLKGLCVGKAEVSKKHPNYMVNREGATAKDVVRLIEMVKKSIKKKFFIELEQEIQFVS